ncbi:unnamed protein product [Parajaminaea phylloscopi]
MMSTAKIEDWILDCGSTGHWSPLKDFFYEYNEAEQVEHVQVANGAKLTIEAWGSIYFENQDTKEIFKITNVGYVPDMSANLISTRLLALQHDWVVSDLGVDSGIIVEKSSKRHIMKTPFIQRYGGYMIPMIPIRPDCVQHLLKLRAEQGQTQVTVPDESSNSPTCETPRASAVFSSLHDPNLSKDQNKIMTWHKRLGHIGISSLSKVIESSIGIPREVTRNVPIPICVPCAISQRHRESFGRSHHIARAPLELVHMDLSGKISTIGMRGYQYFMVFLDDYSRWTWVFLLQTQTGPEILGAINAFYKLSMKDVGMSSGYKLRHLHSDNQFDIAIVRDWCDEHAVSQSFITPYTPQHNSRVERMMRTLKEPAAAMMAAARLPKHFWPFAVLTVAYIRNHVGHSSLNNISPFERLRKKRPDLSHLRVFGCVAYPLLQKGQRPAGAFAEKSKPGVFVGYSALSPGYLIWFPQDNTLFNATRVVFDESSVWEWTPESDRKHETEHQGTDLLIEDIPPTQKITSGPPRLFDGKPQHEKELPAIIPPQLVPRPSDREEPPATEEVAEFSAEGENPRAASPVPILDPDPPQGQRADISRDRQTESPGVQTNNDPTVQQAETPARTTTDIHETNETNTAPANEVQAPRTSARQHTLEVPSEVGDVQSYRRTRSQTRRQNSGQSAHIAQIMTAVKTVQDTAPSNVTLINDLLCSAVMMADNESDSKEDSERHAYSDIARSFFHPVNAAVVQTAQAEGTPIVTSTRRANPMCSLNGKSMRISDLKRTPDWPKWQTAMNTEWNALESQETFRPVVTLPDGKNLVGHKWVFVEKTDKEGNIIKYKARLVAQGFSQVRGVDFTDTFSPVVKLDTLRLLFAVAVQERLQWRLFDVVSAYLYGTNIHEIYMVAPDGFSSSGHPSRILRVLRSLYGLKESGRIWFSTLSDCLEKEGFRMSTYDPCVYIDSKGSVIVIYVDDLAAFARSTERLDEIEELLKSHFKVTVSPSSNSFVGLSIEQYPDKVILHQRSYCQTILRRFGYEDLNSTKAPAPVNFSFDPTPEDYRPSEEVIHDYLSKIGSLLWLSGLTRPDLHQIVIKMARYARCPTEQHLDALKKIFRFIKGSIDLGIQFERDPQMCRPYTLLAYSDANFAEPADGRKSTTGMLLMLGRNCVLWLSKLQSIIAMSTTDAEYIALSTVCREVRGVVNFLTDLFGSDVCTVPVQILCDNVNAVLASDTVPKTTKTRHLDLHHHVIREYVKNDLVKVTRVDTKFNLADVLTKAQRPQAIQDFQAAINLVKIPPT